MRNVYVGRKPPSIGSYDIAKLEQRAREATEGYHGSFLCSFPACFDFAELGAELLLGLDGG